MAKCPNHVIFSKPFQKRANFQKNWVLWSTFIVKTRLAQHKSRRPKITRESFLIGSQKSKLCAFGLIFDEYRKILSNLACKYFSDIFRSTVKSELYIISTSQWKLKNIQCTVFWHAGSNWESWISNLKKLTYYYNNECH